MIEFRDLAIGQYHLTQEQLGACQAVFEKTPRLESIYRRNFNRLNPDLDRTGLDAGAKALFLSGLITSMVDLPELTDYDPFFNRMQTVIRGFHPGSLALDSGPLKLLANSMNTHPESLDKDSNYFDKIMRVSRDYANTPDQSSLDFRPGVRNRVQRLAKEDSSWLSRRVLQEVALDLPDLTVSPRTSLITLDGCDLSKMEVASEVFHNKDGVQYVRVGELFFLNSGFKYRLPKDLIDVAPGNFIFLPELHHSEFAGRLGYYTQNMIASMLSMDLEDRYLLDCGTGTGLLAMVGSRLGASNVLGIDYNLEDVEIASANAFANGFKLERDLTFLHANLCRSGRVLEGLELLGPEKPMTILSNIGSWNDYKISNLTPISYIPKITQILGWSVKSVLLGGYSHTEMTPGYGEEEFLVNFNLPPVDISEDAMKFDIRVIRQLGFNLDFKSVSEPLPQSRGLAHQARSFVASQK